MVKKAGIDWDGDGHSVRRTGTRNGEIVAHINKLKNHTYTNDEIWEVEINGSVLPLRFRAVREAQEYAAQQLAALRGRP